MTRKTAPITPPANPRRFELEELVIVDRQGRPRIELGFIEDGDLDMPHITLYDVNGDTRLTVTLDDNDSPNIDWAAAGNRRRISLGVDQQGEPVFRMMGSKEAGR